MAQDLGQKTMVLGMRMAVNAGYSYTNTIALETYQYIKTGK
jgi:hypothetical protein